MKIQGAYHTHHHSVTHSLACIQAYGYKHTLKLKQTQKDAPPKIKWMQTGATQNPNGRTCMGARGKKTRRSYVVHIQCKHKFAFFFSERKGVWGETSILPYSLQIDPFGMLQTRSTSCFDVSLCFAWDAQIFHPPPPPPLSGAQVRRPPFGCTG